MIRALSRVSSQTITTCGHPHAVLATMASLGVFFEQNGVPEQVLKYGEVPVRGMGSEDIKIKLIAAAVNPSDINTIEGKYPIQPKDRVPGNEGLAEVVEIGNEVQNVAIGDYVVPISAGQGTWRTLAVQKAADWHTVPKELPIGDLATLQINPPTALLMLEEFVDLQPGDTVVQNGATSAVGQAVIQLAKAKGLKTINIIRNRPNWEETLQQLQKLGADVVTTEEKAKADVAASGLPPPKLGLDCVGGSSSATVAKLLSDGGTLVNYGAMGMAPVTVPAPLLIFKDIRVRGFWLSGREGAKAGRGKLLERLTGYIASGVLHTETQEVPLADFHKALELYRTPHTGKKVLLVP